MAREVPKIRIDSSCPEPCQTTLRALNKAASHAAEATELLSQGVGDFLIASVLNPEAAATISDSSLVTQASRAMEQVEVTNERYATQANAIASCALQGCRVDFLNRLAEQDG
jgi:hypothetical protein